jgi:hypothetical protein
LVFKRFNVLKKGGKMFCFVFCFRLLQVVKVHENESDFDAT